MGRQTRIPVWCRKKVWKMHGDSRPSSQGLKCVRRIYFSFPSSYSPCTFNMKAGDTLCHTVSFCVECILRQGSWASGCGWLIVVKSKGLDLLMTNFPVGPLAAGLPESGFISQTLVSGAAAARGSRQWSPLSGWHSTTVFQEIKSPSLFSPSSDFSDITVWVVKN